MANPNSAAFPSAVATDSTLPPATNSFSTTVNANANSSDTSITVVTTATLNVPCIVRIGTEIILATGKSPTTLTGCTRGFDGSLTASHSIGEVVSAYIFDWHFNQLAAEVKAIQTFLGINGGNVILSGGSAAGGDLAGTYPAPILKTIGGVSGTFANADISVDSKGRIIAAASGSSAAGNIIYRGAVAQNGVAVLGFNTPTINPPTAVIYNSAQTLYAVAQFAQNDNVQDRFIIPAGYTGLLTVDIRWRAVATSGAVNWSLAFLGVASGQDIDVSFGTAGVTLANPSGTSKRIVNTTLTGFDISSVAANSDCLFKLSRGTSGDTMSGLAELLSIRFILA